MYIYRATRPTNEQSLHTFVVVCRRTATNICYLYWTAGGHFRFSTTPIFFSLIFFFSPAKKNEEKYYDMACLKQNDTPRYKSDIRIHQTYIVLLIFLVHLLVVYRECIQTFSRSIFIPKCYVYI